MELRFSPQLVLSAPVVQAGQVLVGTSGNRVIRSPSGSNQTLALPSPPVAPSSPGHLLARGCHPWACDPLGLMNLICL